jgi:hypothetical protein
MKRTVGAFGVMLVGGAISECVSGTAYKHIGPAHGPESEDEYSADYCSLIEMPKQRGMMLERVAYPSHMTSGLVSHEARFGLLACRHGGDDAQASSSPGSTV